MEIVTGFEKRISNKKLLRKKAEKNAPHTNLKLNDLWSTQSKKMSNAQQEIFCNLYYLLKNNENCDLVLMVKTLFFPRMPNTAVCFGLLFPWPCKDYYFTLFVFFGVKHFKHKSEQWQVKDWFNGMNRHDFSGTRREMMGVI